MTVFFKKLKSKAGESLVESLCAILIFTMASIVMFSMVSAANDINGEAKEQDKKNQAHLVAVEKGEEEYRNGPENKGKSGTVTFKIGSDTIASVDIDIYGGKDGSLYSFFVHPEPQGG